jgi:hypothetical protein
VYASDLKAGDRLPARDIQSEEIKNTHNMYTAKFERYNPRYEGLIMDEKTTLEVLLSNEFGLKVPEAFKNISPEEWAKYAFINGLEYNIVYYKDNKPYIALSNVRVHIHLSYYEDRGGVLNNYMGIWFKKGYIDKSTEDAGFIPYANGKIFMGQINMYADLAKKLIFNSQKEKDNVFSEEWVEEDGKPRLIEQYGTADLSSHWFDAPEHFLDFEYLIDYQRLFDPISGLLQRH